MKKLTLILVAAFLPYISMAQQSFDKYENMDGVTSVVITSKMFKLLSKLDIETNDKEVQEYMNLVENIKNIKVFTTEKDDVSQKMKADVTSYLKGSKLEELMRVNSDGKLVKIYSKPGKDDDHVSELFMFIDGVKESKEGPNTVVLTITGDIDLKHVSKIADQLNVPGSEELKNVKKN